MKPTTVLCSELHSVYADFPGLDLWPISRDARHYNGPGPIIAHPPCGHWGRYCKVCRLPGRDLGPHCIATARAFAGIVEQPASSSLFRHTLAAGTPEAPDLWGGCLLTTDLWRFGFPSEKLTTVYVVRGTLPQLPPPRSGKPRPLERLSRHQRNATPKDFAAFLLETDF